MQIARSKHAPRLLLPELEAQYLIAAYTAASCILEFGAGGSTLLASSLRKQTFAVESHPQWAAHIQQFVEPAVVLHYVDIGPVGGFGYPLDNTTAPRWADYPTTVWQRPERPQPDLIFIDGRFRVACFLVACAQTSIPATVLFDDYADRPEYHIVETVVPKKEMIGRMAVFELVPGKFNSPPPKLLPRSFLQTL